MIYVTVVFDFQYFNMMFFSLTVVIVKYKNVTDISIQKRRKNI